MKIFIVIHTYNVRKYLAKVLETVKNFDEVLVCDMESTDDTLDIVRKYEYKIVTFPKKNYTVPELARNFAIHSVSNQWVLTVDADEFVTLEPKEFLYEYIQRPQHDDALYIHRKNMFLGKWIKSSYPDFQLHFFDQKKATWPPTIHSVPTIDGTVGQMPKDVKYALVHASISVSSQIKKVDNYTENNLEKRGQKDTSLLKKVFSPFWRFVKYYFFDGNIVISPLFVKDHVTYRKKGYFVTGDRAHLSEAETKKRVLSLNPKFSFFTKELRYRSKMLHLPLLHYVYRGYLKRDGLRKMVGCNMAFCKSEETLKLGRKCAIKGINLYL